MLYFHRKFAGSITSCPKPYHMTYFAPKIPDNEEEKRSANVPINC